MKNKRRRRLSFFICCFKSCFHELSTVNFSYFVRNNFSCIQIDNCADIVLFIVALKICNIAYQYLIGRSCIKFLVEIIFVSSSIVVIIFFASCRMLTSPISLINCRSIFTDVFISRRCRTAVIFAAPNI